MSKGRFISNYFCALTENASIKVDIVNLSILTPNSSYIDSCPHMLSSLSYTRGKNALHM